MSSRSMTININNRTSGKTMTFGIPSSSSGSRPQASLESLPPGQTSSVTSHNSSGGCVGSFSYYGTGYSIPVSYNHPSGMGSTTVSSSPTRGWLSLANATTFPGHDSVARLNFYQGVESNDSGGFVAPLELLQTPPVNNCQDFVNSLFGPSVRSSQQIAGATNLPPQSEGYMAPADFTGGQSAQMVPVWTQRWISGQPDPRCPASDGVLLDFLARYVRTACPQGAMSLWIPQVTPVGNAAPAVYRLEGYRQFALLDDAGNWDAANVSLFLTLMVNGGHFVAISARDDLPPGIEVSAFDTLFAQAGLSSRHDPGNSHYAAIVNTTGDYYQSIDSDWAPENCGLFLAFLVGRTVNDNSLPAGSWNTFFQLEGWQSTASLSSSTRHNADYATYNQTMWNISTFGASAYSEKRATSLFLAPPQWIPQVWQTTRMMPYVGAYATGGKTPQPQGWLQTNLVQIPADAPPLPARYIR